MSAGENDLEPAAAPCFIAKHAVLSGAVLQVATGCFRAPGQRELVLGKVVSLELLTQRADGSLEVTLSAPWNPGRAVLTQPRAHARSQFGNNPSLTRSVTWLFCHGLAPMPPHTCGAA